MTALDIVHFLEELAATYGPMPRHALLRAAQMIRAELEKAA